MSCKESVLWAAAGRAFEIDAEQFRGSLSLQTLTMQGVWPLSGRVSKRLVRYQTACAKYIIPVINSRCWNPVYTALYRTTYRIDGVTVTGAKMSPTCEHLITDDWKDKQVMGCTTQQLVWATWGFYTQWRNCVHKLIQLRWNFLFGDTMARRGPTRQHVTPGTVSVFNQCWIHRSKSVICHWNYQTAK